MSCVKTEEYNISMSPAKAYPYCKIQILAMCYSAEFIAARVGKGFLHYRKKTYHEYNLNQGECRVNTLLFYCKTELLY